MGVFTSHHTMKVIIALSCLLAIAAAVLKNEMVRDVTCTLCKTAIGQLDEYLTSDATEQEIIDFVEQGCAAIGSIIAGAEAACNALVESKLPELIETLVEDNLSPTQVCSELLGLC